MEREHVVRLDAEGDPLAGSRGLAPLRPRHHGTAVLREPDVQQGVGAELLDEQHLAGQRGACRGRRLRCAHPRGRRGGGRNQMQVLRPDAKHKLGQLVPRGRGPDPRRQRDDRARQGRAALRQRGLQQVHRRRADEAGHELVDRVVVQLARRGALLQLAAAEHGDPVPHGHRLDLVVRHVDRGDAEAALQLGDLAAGLHPQLGVQVGQRLVHQEHLRLAHDGPAHGDSLPLPARQLLRLAGEQRVVQVEYARRLADPAVPFRPRHVLHLQRETHVLRDGLARVERVVLEHHGDVAVLGLHVADVPAADLDPAAVERLKAGQHPQRRGLARARRADEHHELAVLDIQVERVDGGGDALGVDAARGLVPNSGHG